MHGTDNFIATEPEHTQTQSFLLAPTLKVVSAQRLSSTVINDPFLAVMMEV